MHRKHHSHYTLTHLTHNTTLQYCYLYKRNYQHKIVYHLKHMRLYFENKVLHNHKERNMPQRLNYQTELSNCNMLLMVVLLDPVDLPHLELLGFLSDR